MWPTIEPRREPINMHSSSGGQMLEAGFCQPYILALT
jgi:hypothetical protein